MQLGGLKELLSSPSGSRRSPAARRVLVYAYFEIKRGLLVVSIKYLTITKITTKKNESILCAFECNINVVIGMRSCESCPQNYHHVLFILKMKTVQGKARHGKETA